MATDHVSENALLGSVNGDRIRLIEGGRLTEAHLIEGKFTVRIKEWGVLY